LRKPDADHLTCQCDQAELVCGGARRLSLITCFGSPAWLESRSVFHVVVRSQRKNPAQKMKHGPGGLRRVPAPLPATATGGIEKKPLAKESRMNTKQTESIGNTAQGGGEMLADLALPRTLARQITGGTDTRDLVVSAGPGGGPHIKIFDGSTNATPATSVSGSVSGAAYFPGRD